MNGGARFRRLVERWRSRRQGPASGAGATITREHVVWAYRLFLDREPESEAAVHAKVASVGATEQLRRDFLISLEFRKKNRALIQELSEKLPEVAAGPTAVPMFAADAGGAPAAPTPRQIRMALPRLRYAGRCNVCGRRGLFRIRPAARHNLRETLDCPRCGSISRDRFLAAVLAACLEQPPIMAAWRVDHSILIREPSAYRGRAELLAEKVDYRPFRFPEETLERLEDADESIDHIIAADVFEHVRLDDLAFREVYRVLKPGGYFFLQVPYSHTVETRLLVRPEGDHDIYLCPPQYHDEDTLVYRIYGRDLLPNLERLGFSVGYVRQAMRRWGVPTMDMIVCRKARPLEDVPHRGIRFDQEWRR